MNLLQYGLWIYRLDLCLLLELLLAYIVLHLYLVSKGILWLTIYRLHLNKTVLVTNSINLRLTWYDSHLLDCMFWLYSSGLFSKLWIRMWRCFWIVVNFWMILKQMRAVRLTDRTLHQKLFLNGLWAWGDLHLIRHDLDCTSYVRWVKLMGVLSHNNSSIHLTVASRAQLRIFWWVRWERTPTDLIRRLLKDEARLNWTFIWLHVLIWGWRVHSTHTTHASAIKCLVIHFWIAILSFLVRRELTEMRSLTCHRLIFNFSGKNSNTLICAQETSSRHQVWLKSNRSNCPCIISDKIFIVIACSIETFV